MLNRAEFGNRRAECLPLLGILQRNREHVFRGSDRGGTQFQASDIQDVECDHVSTANFAEHIFHWHRNVIEIHGRGGTAGDAHLVLFRAAAHSGKVSLDQKRSELFSSNLGKYREQIGRPAVGDPHLLAVQDVVFSVRREVGAGSCGQSIGACQRFGERIRGQHFDFCQLRQVLPLLLLVAKVDDRQRADAGMSRVPAAVRAIAPHAFRRDHQRRQIHGHAAILLGDRHRGQTQFHRFAQHGHGDARLLFADRRQIRLDFVGPEFVNHVADGEMFLAQIFGRENILGR